MCVTQFTDLLDLREPGIEISNFKSVFLRVFRLFLRAISLKIQQLSHNTENKHLKMLNLSFTGNSSATLTASDTLFTDSWYELLSSGQIR